MSWIDEETGKEYGPIGFDKYDEFPNDIDGDKISYYKNHPDEFVEEAFNLVLCGRDTNASARIRVNKHKRL